MGKHFRVIEGGRSPKKDGLDEVPGREIIAELRHIDGSGTRIRYVRPALGNQTFEVKTASGHYWHRKNRFDGSFMLLMLTVPLFGFWMAWKATAPDFAATSFSTATGTDTEVASFGLCHSGGGYNCVVDGDTLYYEGAKIRIADIDTPETHPPRCAEEARLGAAATQRLQQLVSAGPFTLAGNPDGRDEDRYGRKLRIVTRGGESLGGTLVDEGLARWYEGGRRGWC